MQIFTFGYFFATLATAMQDYPRHVVLEPSDLWWERLGVFNPGVIKDRGRTYLVYRALGADRISRFGLAVADDGETFQRFDQPVFEGDEHNPLERLGVEDPRIVQLDNRFLITYTGSSVYPANAASPTGAASLNTPNVPWRIRTMALATKDFSQFDRLGAIIPNLDTKDSAYFGRKIQGRYWLLHRLHPSIYLSSATSRDNFTGGLELLAPRAGWEALKVGAGPPPIETEQGWLLLYHGVSRQGNYAIGAALLARDNPTVVLKRTRQPLFEPALTWEKRGNVANVVFATGLTLHGDKLWIYYGAADKVIGLLKLPLADVLTLLDGS